MKILKSLILCCFIFHAPYCFSQSTDGMAKNESLVTSPQSASLGKYEDVPVNFNTGIPNISIPIYEIREGKMLLPVSLSYHAGGIKVQEEAGPVGLGWTLHAGGAITRIVRGIPDESLYGFFEKRTIIKSMLDGTLSDPNQMMQYKYDLVKGYLDGEPDLFVCNVGGLSFKFSMNMDGQFETFPTTNYKISFHKTSDDVQEWTILDDKGNIYEFGGIDNGVKLTEIVVRSLQPQSPSAWYIRRILPLAYSAYPVNPRKIQFHYIDNSQGSTQTFLQFDSKPLGLACNTFTTPVAQLQIVANMHHAVYLSSIDWSEGQLLVNQTKNRIDNSDLYKINFINIVNPAGSSLKKCRFEYGYFAGVDNNGRLKLTKLVLGPENMINDVTGETINPPVYQFEYDQSLLPDVNSRGQDIWGYFNSGAKNQDLFPSFHIYVPALNQEVSYLYPSNVRSVDPSKCQMGLLKKIIYPTGGFTQFEYESNTESGFDLNKTLVNQPKDFGGNFYYGGVRIKRIINSDPFHPAKDIIRRFDYTGDDGKSSGRVAEIPLYAFVQDRAIWFGTHVGTTIQYKWIDDADYIAVKESSVFPLVNKSNNVYYTKVTVFNGDNGENGKDEYYYDCTLPLLTNENTALPFTPIWQADWRNLLNREVHWKKEANIYKKVQEKFYEQRSVRYSANVKGLHAAITKLVNTYLDYDTDPGYVGPPLFAGELPIDQEIALTTVFYETDYNYPSSETTRTYASDDDSKYIETRIDYEADPVSLKLNKVSSTNSEGRKEIVRKKYSGNYLIPGIPSQSQIYPLGIYNLQQHNILDALVEETKAVDGYVVNSSLTTYSPDAPSVLQTFISRYQSPEIPLDQYQPITINPQTGNWIIEDRMFKTIIELSSYDDNGNLLIQKMKDGQAACVLWDYKNSLPVAEVKLGNAARDIGVVINNHNLPVAVPNFAYTSFEGNNSGYWTGIQSSGIQTYTGAPTGNKVYNLQAGAISHDFQNSTDYYLYFWKKSDANVYLSLDRPNSQTAEVAFSINGWQLMKYTLRNVHYVLIYGSGLIDEVRLFPTDSRISTATYFPGVGIQSSSDLNGHTSYYYYDSFARLWFVKDMEGNILKSYDYQFQK